MAAAALTPPSWPEQYGVDDGGRPYGGRARGRRLHDDRRTRRLDPDMTRSISPDALRLEISRWQPTKLLEE
jgi:hypothetical protein